MQVMRYVALEVITLPELRKASLSRRLLMTNQGGRGWITTAEWSIICSIAADDKFGHAIHLTAILIFDYGIASIHFFKVVGRLSPEVGLGTLPDTASRKLHVDTNMKRA